jgi:hypothetical protein
MADIKVQYETERMNLDIMLVGGRDVTGHPTSAYIGPLNPDDIHNCLYYANRAIIKLFVNHFHVPFDDVDNFMISALSEAMTKEYNDHRAGRSDLEARTSIKFNKNQK